MLGEITVFNNNIHYRIPFKRTFNESQTIQGDSAFGIDFSLLNHTKTESVTLPSNPRIKFFRQMAVSLDCRYDKPRDTGNDGYVGEATKWQDYLWVTGKNRIQDNTEFILEMVRKSDSTVITVIDSVGVLKNPQTIISPRYGIEPDKINHVRTLDSSLSGTEVFYRVKVKRTGDTPYGLTLRKIPFWISQSTLMEYDSIKSAKPFTTEEFNDLINTYFNKIMYYCDSVKTATGYLPLYLPQMSVISKEQDSIFTNKFFMKIYHNGDSGWIEKDIEHYSRSASNENETYTEKNNNMLKIVSIEPQPTNKDIKLIFDSN